jgi:crotonobetainyl-CoA:carnitine CoA-transferase CaiB-like acyl-CoA transferase
VQTIQHIERDLHWQANELVVDAPDGERGVRMHNVIPRLSNTPGEIRTVGGDLGANNEDLFIGDLGLSKDELTRLRRAGVI